jgi:hypothetical protein
MWCRWFVKFVEREGVLVTWQRQQGNVETWKHGPSRVTLKAAHRWACKMVRQLIVCIIALALWCFRLWRHFYNIRAKTK